MKDKLALVYYLKSLTQKESLKTIKILSKNQLQWIMEIIYNVSQGVCPVSDSNKKVLSKHKLTIRRLVAKGATQNQRKDVLQKLRPLLFIFLDSYLQYVS